ncbi:MAG: YggS family pyridoxal phosphate-dependent enzyme [Marmoricola sp.]
MSAGPAEGSGRRRRQLAAGLSTVRERMAAACSGAGRDPAELTLTVVTKFFPASDVRLLAGLGVTHVGENRHQEARAKVDECADVPGLWWHFVGGLQSNKAAAVAAYADVVESLDRTKLVAPLQRGAQDRGRELDVLVQVGLDPPGVGHRNGADPDEVPALAEAVLAAGSLRLRGVMGVAPLGADPRPAFERLAEVGRVVRGLAPQASWMSAGMSADLEQAVRCGATHVRIGSAILGERPRIE